MRPAAAVQIPARPLPRPVRPYPDETTRSFIRRLEMANALQPGLLRTPLKGSRRPWIESLAAWTDYEPAVLMLAMPQLGQPDPDPSLRQKLAGRPTRTTHTAACHRCTLARGAGRYVEIYTTHEQVICPRHGLWLGDGATGFTDQFSIRAGPEITAAWHHHKTSSPGTDAQESAKPSTFPLSLTGAGTTSSNASPPPRKSTTPWHLTSRGTPTARPSWQPRSTPPSSRSPLPSHRRIGRKPPTHAGRASSWNGLVTRSPKAGSRAEPSTPYGTGWTPTGSRGSVGRTRFVRPGPDN